MVVIDYDGDDRSDVRSADTQTLAGDHDYAVFGDSPLNALGARTVWGGGSRRCCGSDPLELLDFIAAEWVWQCLEQHVPLQSRG